MPVQPDFEHFTPPGPAVYAGSADSTVPGVKGVSFSGSQLGSGIGVSGWSASGTGVQAVSVSGPGVQASSSTGDGVYGESVQGQNGVHGKSSNAGGSGVWGENAGGGYGVSGSTNSANAAGVWGDNQGPGTGVKGTSKTGDGVYGESVGDGNGVHGKSSNAGQSGVCGENASGGYGVTGLTNSANAAGVWGNNAGGGKALWGSAPGPGGIGVYGSGGQYAGQFDGQVIVTGQLSAISTSLYAIDAIGLCRFNGDVQVTGGINVGGDINVSGDVKLLGADCAEEFEITRAAEIDPGTVMVLTENGPLQASQSAYDKRVAGVISGAGDYRPGLILDRRHSSEDRLPLALVGKVYCKVDAQYAPVEVGDLLTTSPTPGHAMCATDPLRAFGAVIGKALRRLNAGQGLIPILVALQ